MAKCYKNRIMRGVRRRREAISHAPNGLGNPRETKAFATKSWAGKWSITTVQIGNNFAHTLRDRSQERWAKKICNHKGIDRVLRNGSFSVKNDVAEGRYVDLTKARPRMAEFRSPICS